MTKHNMPGPYFEPLEDLLTWHLYEYGKCWIKIKGIYYPFYAARHLDTKRYTYANTENELLDILEAAQHYETYGDMPKLKPYLTKKVRELTQN